MSKRFALFLFAVWYPLMFIGSAALGECFAAELRLLRSPALMGIVYVGLMVFFAPLLWHAFIRQSK